LLKNSRSFGAIYAENRNSSDPKIYPSAGKFLYGCGSCSTVSSVTVRAGEEKDRDGDGGDHNQQRIDAALHGGSVRVNLRGHGGLRGVFWGSGEVFEENLINWQDNF
jgi:hypothetical protein